MEGLLTLLLFAGLFYVMMRFGCGAHAVHGHSGGQAAHTGHEGYGERHGPQNAARAVDPVCGMSVAPGEGYTKMHAGREYRLCSRRCLDQFDANPDQYAAVQGGA